MTDAIISQHANLRGIAQQLAEVYYIVGAQQLDGYGQECFLAKDETGNEVLIGASLTGMSKLQPESHMGGRANMQLAECIFLFVITICSLGLSLQ